jgi:Ca-activated chloride channel family protein
MATYACLTVAAALLSGEIGAAQIPADHPGSPSIRVDVELVLVPVTVTDRKGRIVSGLDQSRFRVFEEGVPQPIVAFSIEELPASIGMVLDVSGSMKPKMETARSLVSALLKVTDVRDEALFLKCADRPGMQAELTQNIGSFEGLLRSAAPGGWTALVDSVYLTLDRMKPARNSRKVVVVVSDGVDNHSRHTRRELLSRAIESEAQIFTVGTRDLPGARKPIELQEDNQGMAFLDDLAHATGGVYFQVDSADSIPAVAERIALALHHQYLIGYRPTDASRKGLRRIQVKLDVPDTRLYARNAYFAAGQ